MNSNSRLGLVAVHSRDPFIIAFLVVSLLLAHGLTGAFAQTTWRVPEDASTIQAAIESASNGDTVLLTGSTYTGDGNRDVDFMGKAVTVQSAGGNPEFCIIDCQGSQTDPHRGFVFQSGEGSASRLVGISIRGGYASSPMSSGGAIEILNASPEILNCRFIQNFASSKGGAIYCASSSPSISNCVFDSNIADGGGGMTCTQTGGASAPVVTNCLFRNNVADFAGGFEARSYSTPVLEFCTFSNNTANGGAGGIGSDNGVLTVRSCTLTGNSAGFGGAGIMGSFLAGTTVENTMICNSPSGVAVANWDEDFITLTCCNIYGNAGGDWVGVIADQFPGNGNLSEDPQFCAVDPDSEEYWELQNDSPCGEGQSPCGLIGAWPVGCGSVDTREMEWGGVKAMFR